MLQSHRHLSCYAFGANSGPIAGHCRPHCSARALVLIKGNSRHLQDAFRRIADELDPDYVPEWARLGRRPVPGYARSLLSLFGRWLLPRLGLGLIVAGALLEVVGIIVFASRSWFPGTLVFGGGFLATVAGSLMWSAYRMRHWLPGGAASAAPLVPPIPRRGWAWMVLAMLVVLGGLGVMMWLMFVDGSLRGIFLGMGIFIVCSGTAGTVLLRQSQTASIGQVSIAGLPPRRLALILLVSSLILGASLLAQAPLMPASR